MRTMTVSVILCTYNRCESLRTALESLSKLELPPAIDWEILVVDNNSTDSTRQVVEGFAQQYSMRFRYLFEKQQGKSHALNAGIREAKGDILAFTDDDITVDAGWLRQLTANLEKAEWAGAGGRIIPTWSGPKPRWLSLTSPYSIGPLVMFDPSPTAGECSKPPFGANMAFKKTVFEKYGGFRTDLGPCPGTEIRGEDTEFGRRLIAADERIRYEPSAIVFHPVIEKRLRKRFFLNWWFDGGRSEIRHRGVELNTKHYLAHVPLYVLRRTVKWALLWAITIDCRKRFERKLIVWNKFGQITECYRQKLEKIVAQRNSPCPGSDQIA